jgi:ribosomal protein S18 acetylase RimI-like enzyme
MTEPTKSRSFKLSKTRDIDTSLIMELRESVGWGPDDAEVWSQTLQTALEVVSAWDGDALIGVGFLVGGPRHAVLCDLTVTPGWQQNGVGRQIVKDLIDIAQKRDIKYLTLTYDSKKPRLSNFYESLGFVIIDNAMQLKS